jgi:hypothetical protein
VQWYGAFSPAGGFLDRQLENIDMRACFLGQNVAALGFGVAMLQTVPLPEPEPPENPARDASDEPPAPRPQAARTPEAA